MRISHYTGHILSEEEGVNISLVKGGGTLENCVTGQWGGWSLDFDNLTIVTYLMRWNVKPARKYEDFMDPEKHVGKECAYCGGTCDHACHIR